MIVTFLYLASRSVALRPPMRRSCWRLLTCDCPSRSFALHPSAQHEIHALLLAFAEAGANVLRLKGGDPYVFGRGGEEVQYLTQHGIRVHCIPGITAAAGGC